MKKRTARYIYVLLLSFVLLTSCATTNAFMAKEQEVFSTEVSSLAVNVFTTKYGNLYTAAKGTDLFETGFDWGDIVKVSFLDQELSLPLVPNFSYVDTGVAAIVVNKTADSLPEGYVLLAVNMGDFTTSYGIATKTTNPDKSFYWTANEGVTLPLEVTFTMEEKAGYLAEYLIRDLVRTNDRADYKSLSDEEFANFRKVTTTGISNLYRTSNPVNAELGRNTYADKAIEDAGVTVILNLSDSKEETHARAEFKGSYYSTCKVTYLNLGVDFSSVDFQSGLAQGLKFMAANKGIYAVHCTEGKDRAGFVSALLECLMGASAEEVAADYMTTYYNYYGVEKGTEKYNAILSSNIVKTLQTAFGVNDFWTADLEKGAENYLKTIGLTSSEINTLKANLK